MADTRAEQETGFRWDNEGRTLEAWTADPRVAGRWRRAGFVVDVLGRTREGGERTWEVIVPWDGHKRPWLRLFSAAIPNYDAPGSPGASLETEAGDLEPETEGDA